MSIRLMTMAWELAIPSTPKLVLLALCDWANDEGLCFPSVSRVAARACLSLRQSKRVLHQLVDDGWVDVVANHAGGATSRRYQVNVSALRTGVTQDTGAKLTPAPISSPLPVSSVSIADDAHVTQTTTYPPVDPSLQPRSVTGMIVPASLTDDEKVVVVSMLAGLPLSQAQALLDELDGTMSAKKIRTTPITFLRALVIRARRGEFTPSLASDVAARRARIVAEDIERAERRKRSPSQPEIVRARLAEIAAELRGGR